MHFKYATVASKLSYTPMLSICCYVLTPAFPSTPPRNTRCKQDPTILFHAEMIFQNTETNRILCIKQNSYRQLEGASPSPSKTTDPTTYVPGTVPKPSMVHFKYYHALSFQNSTCYVVKLNPPM